MFWLTIIIGAIIGFVVDWKLAMLLVATRILFSLSFEVVMFYRKATNFSMFFRKTLVFLLFFVPVCLIGVFGHTVNKDFFMYFIGAIVIGIISSFVNEAKRAEYY